MEAQLNEWRALPTFVALIVYAYVELYLPRIRRVGRNQGFPPLPTRVLILGACAAMVGWIIASMALAPTWFKVAPVAWSLLVAGRAYWVLQQNR